MSEKSLPQQTLIDTKELNALLAIADTVHRFRKSVRKHIFPSCHPAEQFDWAYSISEAEPILARHHMAKPTKGTAGKRLISQATTRVITACRANR
jgi:hypothetical protein